MRTALSLLFICAWLLGCKSEQDVEPANEPTFMRYYGSQYSHTAHLAIEADNGFTHLSTIEIPTDNLGNFVYKMRLIHTDGFGNTVWIKEYPSFESEGGVVGSMGSYKASSFIALPSGYLIIGERINANGSSDLHLIETDLNGENPKEKSLRLGGASLHGKAVTTDASGNFYVLANVTGAHATDDMFLAKLSATYDSLWSREYADGMNDLLGRLYMNSSQRLVWAGSIEISTDTRSNIRLIQAPENSESTTYPGTAGETNYNETASDLADALGGYLIVGTTDQPASGTGPAGDNNIYLTKFSGASNLLFSSIFDFDSQNDVGNSVCQTTDGGILILATVESGSRKGNGKKDIYLKKLQPSLEAEWDMNYGGLDNEEGASVRPTSDGGYLVFGTTSFGNLKKLMLMKVDEKGGL